MNHLLRPQIWSSFSQSCRLYEPEAWRPRVFLRQAQDRRPLRRNVQVGLGFDFGFWISDLGFLSTIDDIELTAQISPFVLWFSRTYQQIFNPHSAIVDPVARPFSWRSLRFRLR